MVDANKDLNKGKLEKSDTQVGMRDMIKKMKGGKVPTIHFRIKNHIDGIWATKDINCHAEIFIPLWSGIR